MAETRTQTNLQDVGNAKNSSSKARRVRGVSVAPDASQRINQVDFLAKLEALDGKKTPTGFNCAMGAIIEEMNEPVKSKLKEAVANTNIEATMLVALLLEYGYEISSNIIRRHRRRILGKDGCKCQRES